MSAAFPGIIAERSCTARYRVTLAPDLGAALRIINLFAQQGLLPDAVTITARADQLVVKIVQPALAAHRAELIAARMRTQIDVARVTLGLTATPAARS